MRQARSARQKKRPVDYELAAWTAPHPIGRFRIKRRLGEGGMGVVYVGVDDTLQREVAIKLLRSESARPAARIQHPAVCTIFEVGESEGAPFIVMELLDASTREGYEAAERALQRALELSPELPQAHYHYAQLEADTGRTEAALARLLTRLRVRPTDPDIYAGLVLVCRFCGPLDASVAAHGSALTLDPTLKTSIALTRMAQFDYEGVLASVT